MTIRSEHFIEPSDITALRCECKNPECKCVMILPLSGGINDALRVCPKCRRNWAQLGEATFEPEIKTFIEKLMRLKNMNMIGCSLALEISEAAVPKSIEGKKDVAN
jgi:hypothetical protein